jgi:aspartyl-tRNA(Asn)/glutamyl-tRNA(Gln) amidotransferase subunit B
VDKVLSENKKAVEDALVDEKAVHFLIGQLMKETKGKADPQIVNRILRKKIDLKRKNEKKKENSSNMKS